MRRLEQLEVQKADVEREIERANETLEAVTNPAGTLELVGLDVCAVGAGRADSIMHTWGEVLVVRTA